MGRTLSCSPREGRAPPDWAPCTWCCLRGPGNGHLGRKEAGPSPWPHGPPPQCSAEAGRPPPGMGGGRATDAAWCLCTAPGKSAPLLQRRCAQVPSAPSVHVPLTSPPPEPEPVAPAREPWGGRGQAPSAYPVLSLRCLLAAALGPGLAPGVSGAGRGRGQSVLLGQLRPRLLPRGLCKQTLPAVHVLPAACWSEPLGSAGRTPKPPGFPRLPVSLWQMEAVSALLGLPSATSQTVGGGPQASGTQGGPPWVTCDPNSCCHFSPQGPPRLEQPLHPVLLRLPQAAPGPPPLLAQASHLLMVGQGAAQREWKGTRERVTTVSRRGVGCSEGRGGAHFGGRVKGQGWGPQRFRKV